MRVVDPISSAVGGTMAKTVLEKLGLKPGELAAQLGCPADVADLACLPPLAKTHGDPDLLIGFVKGAAEVEGVLAKLKPRYARGKKLWFAYPKKSGAIKTDITRDHGWEALAAANLLLVTQVAIDDTWSALRFRYRDEIPALTRKF
ncbi:hypothetical protein [Piscinibacterium candidicorallinum]|uniref:DUF3052 domain-containing protein n=2 Tax=Piscinibacterium candidicorallinum TaxID=1793872 RepID=A0ABV7H0S6_9BURK